MKRINFKSYLNLQNTNKASSVGVERCCEIAEEYVSLVMVYTVSLFISKDFDDVIFRIWLYCIMSIHDLGSYLKSVLRWLAHA
jgi:hypothetical protein